jgi:hypothetical protein
MQEACCYDRTDIWFVKVDSHTRNVSDIIAYVVGNYNRISWFIFRDSGFYLAYEVSPYIHRSVSKI